MMYISLYTYKLNLYMQVYVCSINVNRSLSLSLSLSIYIDIYTYNSFKFMHARLSALGALRFRAPDNGPQGSSRARLGRHGGFPAMGRLAEGARRP